MRSGGKKVLTKFRARIWIGGVESSLGCFNTPEEAALAYNKKALEVFGEYAYLNKLCPG